MVTELAQGHQDSDTNSTENRSSNSMSTCFITSLLEPKTPKVHREFKQNVNKSIKFMKEISRYFKICNAHILK